MAINVRIESTKLTQDRLYLGEATSHCQQLVDVLKSLNEVRNSQDIGFELVSASKNSPFAMVLEPMNPRAKNPVPLSLVKRSISKNLTSILYGELPHRLTDHDVSLFDKVLTLAKKLVKEGRQMKIQIGDEEFVINNRIATKLESVLGVSEREVGMIRGVLSAANLYKVPTFFLYPQTGGPRIACICRDPETKKAAISNLEELVEIEGMFYQQRRSATPNKIEVTSLSRLADDPEVDFLQFRGSLSGLVPPEGGWLNA